MPSYEKNAMALVDVCRSPIRREIMILAEEAAAKGEHITASMIANRLGNGAKDPSSLSGLSYHVAQLVKAGALKAVGGTQKRGAWQRYLVPSKAFQATMTDTVALDQIAELIDSRAGMDLPSQKVKELGDLLRATGRPVEA